jgi:hypothetical protein
MAHALIQLYRLLSEWLTRARMHEPNARLDSLRKL